MFALFFLPLYLNCIVYIKLYNENAISALLTLKLFIRVRWVWPLSWILPIMFAGDEIGVDVLNEGVVGSGDEEKEMYEVEMTAALHASLEGVNLIKAFLVFVYIEPVTFCFSPEIQYISRICNRISK